MRSHFARRRQRRRGAALVGDGVDTVSVYRDRYARKSCMAGLGLLDNRREPGRPSRDAGA